MRITSQSYNHASRQYEEWGVDDNGQAYMFPVETQLNLHLDDEESIEWQKYLRTLTHAPPERE